MRQRAGSCRSTSSDPQWPKRLIGRWRGFRVILGSWAWMLLVYVYSEPTNTVTVVAIHDARTMSSATTAR